MHLTMNTPRMRLVATQSHSAVLVPNSGHESTFAFLPNRDLYHHNATEDDREPGSSLKPLVRRSRCDYQRFLLKHVISSCCSL